MIQLAVLHKTWLGVVIVRSAPLRAYLKSLTAKKGEAYDDPKSASLIEKFISDYSIDMKTVPEPLSSYTTLNMFFSRAHHPDARPILRPEWVPIPWIALPWECE
jgi:phosphatidylserine decarboxylase